MEEKDMNGFFNSLFENIGIFLEDIYHDIIRKNPFKPKLRFLKDVRDNYDFVEVERKMLSLDEVSVQYNPERFAQYKSVHKGVYDNVLDMSQSPHCQLLRDYNRIGSDVWQNFHKHPYYRMQRRFGKSRKSAMEKAKRLTALFDDIKTNGFKGEITVIDKPLIPNPYNQSFEIYDGHHRAACGIVLGIKSIDAVVLKAEPKNNHAPDRHVFKSLSDIVCKNCLGYSECKERDTQKDFSLRRCQRMIEKENYGNLQNLDILEIGCGAKEKGGYIKTLVEANNCRWTGIDILPTNLATHVCSVEKMPFPEKSFDVVIGSQTIEHWKNPNKALKEIYRVLKDNGFVSLTAPIHLHGHKNFVTGNFDKIHDIILRSGFKIERFETWRRKHSDLPVCELKDYHKKYLRKAGILKYDNVAVYLVHIVLRKAGM